MKFLQFIREDVNDASVTASDTGASLSVLVVPTSSVSFISAVKGAVSITFNDAGVYEESKVLDGEAVEKTKVLISCKEGQELGLIDDITSFITQDTARQVMKFDVTSGKSLSRKVELDSVESIVSKVSIKPTVINTGKLSTGDAETEYQGTVGEIFFGVNNLPALDFNHEGLKGYSDGAEVTDWRNSGTLGKTHSIASNVGAPLARLSSTTTDLSTTSVQVNLDSYFIVPNSFEVEGEYTAYGVIKYAVDTDGVASLLFGDDVGETIGHMFNGDLAADGGVDKVNLVRDVFSMRHSGRTGAVATVNTIVPFPEQQEYSAGSDETCEVVVIRRDSKSNLYLHNRSGEVIARIPALTAQDTRDNLTADSMTDGNLLIQQLGSVNGLTTYATKGYLARFGVIKKDIGTAAASQLAQDLFNLYNL